MRARRSSSVIGGAGFGKGLSARIDSGIAFTTELSAPRLCAVAELERSTAVPAAIADACTNVRLVTRM
jgi:hypothetical protein